MSKQTDVPNVKRRRFLKGAGLAGAAALASPLKAVAAQTTAPARNAVPLPNRAAETQVPPALEQLTVGRSGSDFMIDCLKSLGF